MWDVLTSHVRIKWTIHILLSHIILSAILYGQYKAFSNSIEGFLSPKSYSTYSCPHLCFVFLSWGQYLVYNYHQLYLSECFTLDSERSLTFFFSFLFLSLSSSVLFCLSFCVIYIYIYIYKALFQFITIDTVLEYCISKNITPVSFATIIKSVTLYIAFWR